MKFSINWLKTFVEISLTPQDLADKLSLAGHEVEGIDYIGDQLKQIVTGRIEKIEKHPNADRLSVCQIFDGKDNHQILTAATNIFEGAIIPVSLPGSVLANGLKIKATDMRGLPSNGMLCSEVELGQADESPGIWILPEDTPVGVDFIEYGHLRDAILDIGILPNRGDCQSILGMAREISALLDTPLTLPDMTVTREPGESGISINLHATDHCPLYTGQLIQGVTDSDSPRWMAQRLKSAGIRPISLLVDITNYVMLEMGQPLHAFDFRFLSQKAINVRYAKNGETLTTLDEQVKTLNDSHLLICDGDTPVALGGIMGGLNSEIKADTQDVFLEAGLFDATATRRTAVALNCRTESAMRFEKGVDPENVAIAATRALHLYQTLTGGRIIGEHQVIKEDSHPYFQESKIAFTLDKLNGVLGTHYSAEQVTTVLNKLGVQTNAELTQATVPSWRRLDMVEHPCLSEEVSRILGFDHIETYLPKAAVAVEPKSRRQIIEATAITALVNQGFSQTNTYPMISPSDVEKLGGTVDDSYWVIQNPLSIEESVMRQSLIPSLLTVTDHNLKRQQRSVNLFEIAKTYYRDGDTLKEDLVLTITATGERNPYAYNAEDKAQNQVDFYQLKGLAENLFKQLGLKRIQAKAEASASTHPVKSVTYTSINTPIAKVAILHPNVTKQYDINQPVGLIEVNLSAILGLPAGGNKYKAFSKFPSSSRDIAILTPKATHYDEILGFLNKQKAKFATEVTLFDVFESERIGNDKRSLAVRITYQKQEETLSDDEVNTAHTRLCEQLVASLPVEIR